MPAPHSPPGRWGHAPARSSQPPGSGESRGRSGCGRTWWATDEPPQRGWTLFFLAPGPARRSLTGLIFTSKTPVLCWRATGGTGRAGGHSPADPRACGLGLVVTQRCHSHASMEIPRRWGTEVAAGFTTPKPGLEGLPEAPPDPISHQTMTGKCPQPARHPPADPHGLHPPATGKHHPWHGAAGRLEKPR